MNHLVPHFGRYIGMSTPGPHNRRGPLLGKAVVAASAAVGLLPLSAGASPIATANTTVLGWNNTATPATNVLVDLTAQGTSDWALWGKLGTSGGTTIAPNTVAEQKSSGFMIGGLTLGGGAIANSMVFTPGISPGFGFEDGTPTSSVAAADTTSNYEYVHTNGGNNYTEAFNVTLPTGTTSAAITVWSGLFTTGGGSTTITLSGGELSSPVSGTALTPGAGGSDTNRGMESVAYTITGIDPTSAQIFTLTDTNTVAVGNFGFDAVTIAAVPEPATLTCLAFAGAGLLMRHRRNA